MKRIQSIYIRNVDDRTKKIPFCKKANYVIDGGIAYILSTKNKMKLTDMFLRNI